ncbi:MAG: hypothetical protein N2202_07975 [Proteobacteria bacterium]|nr:hypothetical protein [Pseudomonadota bacterium]
MLGSAGFWISIILLGLAIFNFLASVIGLVMIGILHLLKKYFGEKVYKIAVATVLIYLILIAYFLLTAKLGYKTELFMFTYQAGQYSNIHKFYAIASVIGLLSSLIASALFFLLTKKINRKRFLSRFIASVALTVIFAITTLSVFISPFGLNILGDKHKGLTTYLYKGFVGSLYLPSQNGDIYPVLGETILPYVKPYLITLKKFPQINNNDDSKNPKAKANKIKLETVTEKEVEERFKKEKEYLIKVEQINDKNITFRVESSPKKSMIVNPGKTFTAPKSIIENSIKLKKLYINEVVFFFIFLTFLIVAISLSIKAFKTTAEYGKNQTSSYDIPKLQKSVNKEMV